MRFVGLGVLLVLIACGAQVGRRGNAARTARWLRRSGFGLMAAVALISSAFLVGETFEDPGGPAAVGWTASWLAPLAALIALAWKHPPRALPVFVTLAGIVVGLTLWAALQPGAWRGFEDGHGPVRTVIVLVLAAAIAVYGLHLPRAAGVLLLCIGVVPLALSSLAEHLASGSLVVAATPASLTGVLYLAAAQLDPATGQVPVRHPKDRIGVR